MIRGLMSDVEWTFFEPFVVASGPLSGRPPSDHRCTLDGIFWVMRTGAPWRDLPEELGKWNTVYRQFLRWSRSGLWDFLLEGLAHPARRHDKAGKLYPPAIRRMGSEQSQNAQAVRVIVFV